MKKRTIALLMAVVMLFGATVGGTIAWLTAQSSEVKNTFTVGDINIELWEHDYEPTTNTLNTTEVNKVEDYKMIPGIELPKDPFVRVLAGSEKCHIFVTMTKSDNFDTYMTTAVDSDNWELVTGNVYHYKTVVTAPAELNILEDQLVSVKEDVTKAQLEAAKENNPTLTFKAYAIQSENLPTGATLEQIWTLAQGGTI